MINKYTSCKRVISKVLTELDIPEGQKYLSSMIEWIGEAMEKIGAAPQFIVKTTGLDGEALLEVSNYQTKLPLGLHNIMQVSCSLTTDGNFYTMIYGTGTRDYNKSVTPSATINSITMSDSDLVSLYIRLYGGSYADAVTALNSNPDIKETLYSFIRNNNVSFKINGSGEIDSNNYTYVINGNYIKTNFREGYIKLTYQALALDIDGYPMIPDDMGYIDAIFWYITKKLYYGDWKAGRIRDAVYYDAVNNWNFYCNQAYGNALMPNVDMLESIKNSWLRIIPNIDAHSTNFSSLSNAESLR